MRKNRVVQGKERAARRAAPAAGLGLALGIVLALGAAGCGRNGGDLPTGFTPTGVGGQDNVLLVEVVQDSSGGTAVPVVQATVYDRTVADGYRLYSQVGDGGFGAANEYISEFTGTWNQGYESYVASDRRWQPTETRNYLARGTVQGEESGLSPLTNYASVPPGDVEAMLPDTFLTVCPIDTAATDSVPRMVWEPVPGAVRYLLRIIRTDSRVFFLGITPSTGVTDYQLGSGTGSVLQESPLTKSAYFWTVVAIDADWRVIGRTPRQIFVVDPEEAEPPCTP